MSAVPVYAKVEEMQRMCSSWLTSVTESSSGVIFMAQVRWLAFEEEADKAFEEENTDGR